MSLLGQGAIVMWHDVRAGRAAEHDDWHSHEHIPERIGIPGFRRGRRCRGGTGWFILYEVDSLAVLTSSAYLERLNNPSVWSTTVIPTIIDMNRTLARVEQSHGAGVGGFVLTIRSESDVLGDTVSHLPKRKGITGAHVLRGDIDASGVRTREKSLRDQPDGFADWVTVIEGYDKSELEEIGREVSVLADEGRSVVSGLYEVNHMVSEIDR